MRKHWEIYLFILPALIYLIIFNYVPIYGIQLAFKRFSPLQGIWGSSWVGFTNFTKFFEGYFFERTIRNTISIAGYSIIAGLPFPILLALMLNEIKLVRFKKMVQTVSYAPYFISTVVMVGMLFLFLDPNHGISQRFFALFGLDRVDLINSNSSFQHVFVWSGIWQFTGFSSIIYLAALSSVDPQLHEAAMVDGATKLQRILHINLPSLKPTILMLFILSMGGIMSVAFEKVFLMQSPLNLDTSEVLSTYIYKLALGRTMDFGMSTAVNLFSSVVNALMLIIANQVSKLVARESLW